MSLIAIVVLMAIPLLTAAVFFVDRQASDAVATVQKSNGLAFDIRLRAVVATLHDLRKDALAGRDVTLRDRLAVERALTRLYDYGSARGRSLGVEKSLERLQNAWVAVPARGDIRPELDRTIAQAYDVGTRIEDRAGLRSGPSDVATDLLDAFATQLPAIDKRTDRQRNLLLTAAPGDERSTRLAVGILADQVREAFDSATADVDRAAAREPSVAHAAASLARAERAWQAFDATVRDPTPGTHDRLLARGDELAGTLGAASADIAADALVGLDARLESQQRALRWLRFDTLAAAACALFIGIYLWRTLRARERRENERLEAGRETERMREILALTEARFEAVFDRLSLGIAILDTSGAIVRTNAALETMIPDPTPEQVGAEQRDVRRVLAGEADVHTAEFARRVAGETRWLEANVSLVRDDAGAPLYAVAILKDVTERRASDDALRYEAKHDTLLQIPNRAYLIEKMHETVFADVADAARSGVMFVDLDGFKVVNDSLGHEIGDRVLVAAARRLTASVDAGDFVARFGGDEFVTLLQPRATRGETIEAAHRVVRALAVPFDIDGREIFVTVSAGLALLDRPYESVEGILRDADTAMYHAKVSGGSRCAVFDAEMRDSATRRLELASQLRRALEREQIFLVFQPVLTLATERVASFEVLVRWEHPELGLVAPSEFIPLAEELGLIVPIGRWVLERACAQLARWREESPAFETIYLAVNASVRELLQTDYCDFVERTLERHGLHDGDLVLEVTETAVMQSDRYAQGTLQRLKRAGVGLAIDDFGTGYSSLRYLQHFPFDHLKIDASFVRGADGELASEPIVTMLLTLGRSFGVNVIAEGVETKEQAAMLRSLGCTSVQGYLYGLPAAPSLVRDLLERRDTPMAS